MTATPHLAEIDAMKATLNARRPLSKEEIRGLATVFEAEETEYIHESNRVHRGVQRGKGGAKDLSGMRFKLKSEVAVSTRE